MTGFIQTYTSPRALDPTPAGWAWLQAQGKAASLTQRLRRLTTVLSWARRAPGKAAGHPHHARFVAWLAGQVDEDRVIEQLILRPHLALALDFPWTDEGRLDMERQVVEVCDWQPDHLPLIQALIQARPHHVLLQILRASWGEGIEIQPSYLAELDAMLADPDEREAFERGLERAIDEWPEEVHVQFIARASETRPAWVAQRMGDGLAYWPEAVSAGVLMGPADPTVVTAWSQTLVLTKAWPLERAEAVRAALRQDGNPNVTEEDREAWENQAATHLATLTWVADWEQLWQTAWPVYRARRRQACLVASASEPGPTRPRPRS